MILRQPGRFELARCQTRTVRSAADDRLQPGLQRIPSLAAAHARHHLGSRSTLARRRSQNQTVRIPGQPDETPQGLYSFDSRSIARIHSESHWLGRPLLFATPALHLVGRSKARTAWSRRRFFLPNDIRLNPANRQERAADGRLSCAAGSHTSVHGCSPSSPDRFRRRVQVPGTIAFFRAGAWKPDNLPPNVRLCGHVDEDEKTRLLSEAWVAVNTSVHEGMPVSFLEALACETPFLSGSIPATRSRKFGIITGRTDGDGMQGLEAFRTVSSGFSATNVCAAAWASRAATGSAGAQP